ncbi:MAG TPA: hypothetical protein VGF41_09355, partial [Myxococcaceae bacterium]
MSKAHGHPASLPRRRDVLWLLGAASLYPLLGCGTDAGELGSGSDGGTSSGSCASIPEETAGPYPGDGSNGPNALALSGVVRSDIRASLGASSAVATGVPLTLTLTLVNPVSSCAPLVGAAVYVWHCDALGRYSLYSSGVTGESWLRGSGKRRIGTGALHHHLPRLLQRALAARALRDLPVARLGKLQREQA